MKAWLNLRHPDSHRAEAFTTGLKRLGYAVEQGCTLRPGDRDIMVSWNRIREAGPAADAFEAAGRPVLITENASWGNGFAGESWVTMAKSFHNVAGQFPMGGPERWDRLRVDLWDMRRAGEAYSETVILPSRGIGPVQTKMPTNWLPQIQALYPKARTRIHPGRHEPQVPLEHDLLKAKTVITWGSGAAIKAAMLGIKVFADLPRWIGQSDNTEKGRLQMFRDLAWAQWRLDEIRRGDAFRWLL